ncbi:MAG: cohesin domain-containing protein, partial [Patescibacteria group bacterium]
SLLFTPATGSFTVGSTFNVSIAVNTGGKSINAVRADIKFPANKLQVVNPSAGTSFISIWVNQPAFSNTAGTISFQGGLPSPGIKTDSGIVSTITFRATAPGPAKLTFQAASQVLANDGQGTDLLTSRGDANFTLALAAPEGPIVSSASHPDQNAWYQNRSVNLEWDEIAGAVGYSYAFDQNSRTTPPERDDATTTRTASVVADKDGRWYFHVRAKVTSWGGTSHYSVLLDGTSPAGFTPSIDPEKPEPGRRPELKFLTTDAMSGLEHYEMQLIALDDPNQATPFFVEQTSPVRLPELQTGRFQVIVRAFDQAGNSVDGKLEFTVATPEQGGSVITRIPLLQNTFVMNMTLIVLGILVVGLLVWVLLRRRRRPMDVIHDIQRLEQETVKKESELMKTIQAARQMEQSIESQVQHQQELAAIQQQVSAQQTGKVPNPQPPMQQPPATPSADFLHSDQNQQPPTV